MNNKEIIDSIETKLSSEPISDIVTFKQWPDFGERLKHFVDELPNLRSASVMIPIVTSGDEPYVIFTERSRNMTNHPGQISFPGGGQEGTETLLQTAIREAEEEIGLPQNQVRPLGYLHRYPTISAFQVTIVVAEVIGDFTPKLQTEEVVSLIRVPLSYLMDKDNHKLVRIEFNDEKIRVAEINFEGNRIWGATAGMIVHLYETLYL